MLTLVTHPMDRRLTWILVLLLRLLIIRIPIRLEKTTRLDKTGLTVTSARAVLEIGVLFLAAVIFRLPLTQTARAPLARSCQTPLGLAPSWQLALLVCMRKLGPDCHIIDQIIFSLFSVSFCPRWSDSFCYMPRYLNVLYLLFLFFFTPSVKLEHPQQKFHFPQNLLAFFSPYFFICFCPYKDLSSRPCLLTTAFPPWSLSYILT